MRHDDGLKPLIFIGRVLICQLSISGVASLDIVVWFRAGGSAIALESRYNRYPRSVPRTRSPILVRKESPKALRVCMWILTPGISSLVPSHLSNSGGLK